MCSQILLRKENHIGKAMFSALNFAWSNRQMITHWTRNAFERVFKQSESDLDMKLVYDVAHNIAKVENHKVNGENRKVVVHRKGATRAFPANRDEIPSKYRDLGQPVLNSRFHGNLQLDSSWTAKFYGLEFWLNCTWRRKNHVKIKGKAQLY